MRLSIGRVIAVAPFLCLLIVGVFGCDFFPTQNKDGLPADHSDKKTYAYHKSLSQYDVIDCATCHGESLKGGISTADRTATPSCYQCHGDVWGFTGHTVKKSANGIIAYHKPDLYQPLISCTECHGQDIKGGTYNGFSAPSCYKCHGALWDYKQTHTVRKDGKYHHPDYKRNPSMCQDCHGVRGQGGTARSCYGSGCHGGSSWPPDDDD